MPLAAISLPSPTPAPEDQIHLCASLVMQLSGQFSHLRTEEIAPAIAGALEQLGRACATDHCCLIEFDERGLMRSLHSWANPEIQSPADLGAHATPWLIHQLSRNELAAVTNAEDYPFAAVRDRAHARKLGIRSSLGVPGSVADRVVCALWLGCVRHHGEWATPLVERVRLIAEILATALQRSRHDRSLHAKPAEINRANPSVKGDQVKLPIETETCGNLDEIIGNSQPLKVALERLRQVAPVDSTVILLGETGTGKELFARALHERSARRGQPFVRVNCAALAPTLIESELFGHEKGAFTGAIAQRQGRFEIADGGTIFLDEVGDLPAEVQVKLLRVLQEREFERVGSSRCKRVDVRVIAATHRNLEAAAADGTFRADLYYRLSVFPIHLPALRERREDIPELVWFFIGRRQRALGRRIGQVPQSVMDTLQAHAWPGNIRELENVIERAMIRSTGDTLRLDDNPETQAIASPTVPGRTLDAVQRTHIEAVLRECGWRINGRQNAADRLGLHPNTLRFRIQKLGIVRPEARRPQASA
jgi:formate hydrogenlyase transcriptional activator